MAIISRDYLYIFICTPGTGSTATENTLITHYKGQYIENNHFPYTLSKHFSLAELLDKKILQKEKINNYNVFTTVRNHYDYFVSEWIRHRNWSKLLEDQNSWVHQHDDAKERISKAMTSTFSEYLMFRLRNTPDNSYLYKHFWVDAHYIMKIENLDEDFRKVLNNIGITFFHNIEKINVTENKSNS